MTVELNAERRAPPASDFPFARLLAGAPQWLADPDLGLWRYGVVIAIVLLGAGVSEALLLGVHMTRISVVLLATVVLSASWFGARPALFAAFFAFAVYNLLLLQPVMRAKLGSTEQLITLAVFLVVALSTGSTAGRVRDEGRRSATLAANNRALFQASSEMSFTDEESEVRRILLTHVTAMTGARADIAPAETRNLAAPMAYRHADHNRHDLRADDERLGVLTWTHPEGRGASEDLVSTIRVLGDLCAASIARVRLSTHKARLAAAAQVEQVQTALLSSISHDFRTPLSAIMTSASSLKDYGESFSADTRGDLCATIQEEAERLNRYVINLLHMTKLDSGVLRSEQTTFDVVEIVNAVVERLERAAPTLKLSLDLPSASLASGDPVLFEHALANVIENAVRFSPPETPVAVAVSRVESMVLVTVADRGPGVPEHEIGEIFERFFRASNNMSKAQGCGLGLSITRGLLGAMGGKVVAERGADGVGLVVRISAPVASA